jgi:hypothetical protein
MRYTKLIGLTSLAALVLFALWGGGSAAASVACKVDTHFYTAYTCPAAQLWPANTVITTTLEGSSTVKNGSTTLSSCTGGKFTSTIVNAGSSTSTVTGSNTTVDLESCTSSIHTENLGSFEIHHISGTADGTVTTSGMVIGNTVFGTNCLYETGSGKDLGTLSGGSPASLSINASLNESEPRKFICPDTATWTAKWIATSPKPLYMGWWAD